MVQGEGVDRCFRRVSSLQLQRTEFIRFGPLALLSFHLHRHFRFYRLIIGSHLGRSRASDIVPCILSTRWRSVESPKSQLTTMTVAIVTTTPAPI